MKQWPFAHTIEVTYRLENGVLEVRTKVTNHSAEPMPLAIGFHPYLQLTDSPRDEWTIAVAHGSAGCWRPTNCRRERPSQSSGCSRILSAVPLNEHDLDDVFRDLVRDPSGRATLSVRGRTQAIDSSTDRSIARPSSTRRAAATSSASSRWSGVTNALNLAHKGLYRELQSVAPGETWQESFWIVPSGF